MLNYGGKLFYTFNFMSFISFLFLFVYTLLSAFLLVGGMVGSESLIFSYVLYFAVKIERMIVLTTVRLGWLW